MRGRHRSSDVTGSTPYGCLPQRSVHAAQIDFVLVAAAVDTRKDRGDVLGTQTECTAQLLRVRLRIGSDSHCAGLGREAALVTCILDVVAGALCRRVVRCRAETQEL